MCHQQSAKAGTRAWRELKREGEAGIRRRRRRSPRQSEWNRSQGRASQNVRRITSNLVRGKIDAGRWYQEMDASLWDAHSEAWALGRQRAGDLRVRGEDDDLAGRAIMDVHDERLLRFRDDLLDSGSSLYDADGNLRQAAVHARAQLYARAIRGTANEAFVEAGPEDAVYYWRLGGSEAHCADCPVIAALNPYDKNTLMAYPGDGGTPCLGNCKCYLERGDGVVAFERTPTSLRASGSGDDKDTPEPPGTVDEPKLPKLHEGGRYLNVPQGTTLADMRPKLAKYEREVLCVHGGDGELLYAPLVGKESEVDLGPFSRLLRDMWVSHNHPNNSLFSVDDIKAMWSINMAALEVVTQDGFVYVLSRPSYGWPALDAMLRAYAIGKKRARKAGAGNIARRRAQMKEINRALRKELGDDAPQILEAPVE